MKVRGRLLIFLLIASLFCVVSFADEKVYTEYVYSGDEFIFDEDDFSVRLSVNEKILVIKNDYEGISVQIEECEITAYYKYCFYNTVVDFSNDLGKLHDYTGEVMPALNVTITSLKPDIEIKRTASKTKPFTFEEVLITTTFTNNGRKDVNIRYDENITSPAKLLSCKGCTAMGDKLIYVATLPRGSEKIIEYRINPQDMDKLVLSPTFSYESDILNGTISVASITIEPVKALSITYSGSKKPIIEDEIEAELIFKNNDPDETAKYVTTLYFDDDLVFSSSDNDVVVEDDKLMIGGSLSAGEEKTYEFLILSKKSGAKNIFFETDYRLGNQELSVNDTLDFESLVQKPKIEFDILTEMYSDMPNHLGLVVDNYDSINGFKDMYVTVSVDGVFDENFIIPFLKFGREVNAYNRNFTILSKSAKDVKATINMSYKTVYDEIISHVETKTIKVKPTQDVISITHELEDYKQAEGDLIVSTFITSNDIITQIFNVSEDVIGADILTNDGRELFDYSVYTKSDYLYVEPKSTKKTYSYIARKIDNDQATIKTKTSIKGINNVYLATHYYLINFSDKTIKSSGSNLSVTSGSGFNEVVLVEEESSGVIQENIEIEETHTYEAKEEIIAPVQKETKKEETTNTQEQTSTLKEDTTPTKKNFFQKIWEVILSFF
ncbi:hypothetical protein GOV05_05755 [Candidatus Woesearchaeota archaeon]|nr:hypothetical protein [Candidatus Woesearchaeota archaeon]